MQYERSCIDIVLEKLLKVSTIQQQQFRKIVAKCSKLYKKFPQFLLLLKIIILTSHKPSNN